MALIEETGTGNAAANTYGNIAGADAYHLDFANAAWAALTTQQKTAALLKATRYIDGKYRNSWRGNKTTVTQALCWPRMGVNILDSPGSFLSGGGVGNYQAVLHPLTIPERLKHAVYEAALIASTTELQPMLRTSIASESITGVISTTFKQGATPGQVKYQVIDQLLSDLVEAGGMLVRS